MRAQLLAVVAFLSFSAAASADVSKLDPKLRHLSARARDGQLVRGAAVRSSRPFPTEMVRLLKKLSVNRSATEKLVNRAFRSDAASARGTGINGVARVPGSKVRVQVFAGFNRGDGVIINRYRHVTLTQSQLGKLLAQ